jgi:hypothetical protein
VRLRLMAVIGALFCAIQPPAIAAEDPAFDPKTGDPADIVACKIGALQFTGFVMTLTTGGEPGSWDKRGWTQKEAGNDAFTQYMLPKPIAVFGNTTDSVIFTNLGMMAVIDSADPVALGKANGIAVNALPQYFTGQKIVDDSTKIVKTDVAKVTVVNRIALTLRTYPTHPGKVMLGCKYDADVEITP